MKKTLALSACLLWLPVSAAWAAADGKVFDLRDALQTGQVQLVEVTGSGTLGAAAMGALLRNDSTDHILIRTTIEKPLYFSNETSNVRTALIATEIFLADAMYRNSGKRPTIRFFEIPPESRVAIKFVAYSTDFEKEPTLEGDRFFYEEETPHDLASAAETISDLTAKHPELDTSSTAQFASWSVQGRTAVEIRSIFDFSFEDLKTSEEILKTVAKQPQTNHFRWQPRTFWCVDECVVDELSFAEVYPVPFYQTDAFTYTVIATSVATAATVTFVTAGAGAPALAPGAGWLVVLAGGGGQGAYMAGLSTIGSLIGSNAVGGAAIINSFGAVVGLTAGVRSAAFGGVALKTMFGVSAAAYDGILIGENESTGELLFVAELPLPTELGSGWAKELAESIYENEQKAAEALDAAEEDNFAKYMRYRTADLQRGVDALKRCWPSEGECFKQNLSRDDLVTLSIIAYKAGEFDLFHSVIAYLSKRKADIAGSTSFLDYLYATSLMMQSNLTEGAALLKSSIAQDPGIIEPTLLYIAYLGQTDFEESKERIESLLSELAKAYDDDDYRTSYSLATAYFRVGHIYAANGYYKKAIMHFDRAKAELNFLQKWPIFSGFMNQKFRQDIELDMAISHFRAGDKEEAKLLYEKLANEQKSEVEKEALTLKYLCSTTPKEARDECGLAGRDGG